MIDLDIESEDDYKPRIESNKPISCHRHDKSKDGSRCGSSIDTVMVQPRVDQ